VALFGLGSLSDLSPLYAQKRKSNVTTIWLALGNLWRCIDWRCSDFGLMIASNSNQEFAPMSKPTTNENDKQPDPPKLFKGLPLPDNCRDVTAERIGEKFALVGPPMRRIKPTKD
jgi:hypothetical protein